MEITNILTAYDENGNPIPIPAIRGPKGENAKDAIYVGADPAPDGTRVQIDPNGETVILAQNAFELPAVVPPGIAAEPNVQSVLNELAKPEGELELIEEFTLIDPVVSVSRNAEPDGTAYRFSAIKVLVNAVESTEGQVNGYFYPGNTLFTTGRFTQKTYNFMAKNDRRVGQWEIMYAFSPYKSNAQIKTDLTADRSQYPVSSFSIFYIANDGYFGPGTKITIWAVRA